MKMGLVLDMMIMETVLGFYQRNRTTRAYVRVCVCVYYKELVYAIVRAG